MRAGVVAVLLLRLASGCAATLAPPDVIPPVRRIHIQSREVGPAPCEPTEPDPNAELAVSRAVVQDLTSGSSKLWPDLEKPTAIGLAFDSDPHPRGSASGWGSVHVEVRASASCATVTLTVWCFENEFAVTIEAGHLDFTRTGWRELHG